MLITRCGFLYEFWHLIHLNGQKQTFPKNVTIELWQRIFPYSPTWNHSDRSGTIRVELTITIFFTVTKANIREKSENPDLSCNIVLFLNKTPQIYLSAHWGSITWVSTSACVLYIHWLQQELHNNKICGSLMLFHFVFEVMCQTMFFFKSIFSLLWTIFTVLQRYSAKGTFSFWFSSRGSFVPWPI